MEERMFRLFCAASALMLLAFFLGVVLSVETKDLLSHLWSRLGACMTGLWSRFLDSIGYVHGPVVPAAFQQHDRKNVSPATPAEVATMEKNIMTVLKS
jgi:hypothetical protein